MSSLSFYEKRMNLGSEDNATTTYGSKGWVFSKSARNFFNQLVWLLNAMTVRHCALLTFSHGIQKRIITAIIIFESKNKNIDKQKGRLFISGMQRYIIVSMFLNLDTFYY